MLREKAQNIFCRAGCVHMRAELLKTFKPALSPPSKPPDWAPLMPSLLTLLRLVLARETVALLQCCFKGHKTFCPFDQVEISFPAPFLWQFTSVPKKTVAVQECSTHLCVSLRLGSKVGDVLALENTVLHWQKGIAKAFLAGNNQLFLYWKRDVYVLKIRI